VCLSNDITKFYVLPLAMTERLRGKRNSWGWSKTHSIEKTSDESTDDTQNESEQQNEWGKLFDQGI
jgi:hypothetical protein